MESYLYPGHYDLITPDGRITQLLSLTKRTAEATVLIENISPAFVGFHIDPTCLSFNIKSSLAQLGINAIGIEYLLEPDFGRAEVKVHLKTYGELGIAMLELLEIGCSLGKLFAADERRKVRDPEYLLRMFGRTDRWGRPLLYFGNHNDSSELALEKKDGFTIAHIAAFHGCVAYHPTIHGLLPTLALALKGSNKIRDLLRLHQYVKNERPLRLQDDKLLLLRTQPLHVRTVFCRVKNTELPEGMLHTTADILEPDTNASGDIYEFYGSSHQLPTYIPLEFYTLEPHREHVFFSDRDQLQSALENATTLFDAFATAPHKETHISSIFIVKGTQLQQLSAQDWIQRQPHLLELPGIAHSTKQLAMVEKHIQQQPAYPFLKAIESGLITSQGVLFSTHFPSPLLKNILLSETLVDHVKGIYFQHPSWHYEDFFSQPDRALLNDLTMVGIPVYWLDKKTNKILQFIQKPHRDAGIFAPLEKVDAFIRSTLFGVYGSNLLEGSFENELMHLFSKLLEKRHLYHHPQFNAETPLALFTGGGPGAMALGNRVAKTLNILSCANIVDFESERQTALNAQPANPHIEAKMTYRIEKLFERQAEFHLNFPIFLIGGVGTDFEYALEEVSRRIGMCGATPVLLFGTREYWRSKVTSRFQCNLAHGTLKGGEWISNCFYCVRTGEQALSVYERYFSGTLPIGPKAPIQPEGFTYIE